MSLSATFVGIDLAWGYRNPSGVAVLGYEQETLQELTPAQWLHNDEQIVETIAQYAGTDTLVIAIDAPLVVPNQVGERPVEKEMRRRYARYHAACHPANRRLLGNPPRGEQLCALLAQKVGIHVAPSPPVQQACRIAFEVYPHAALVTLFRLPQVLQYKARRGRSFCHRLQQMEQYLEHLRRLSHPTLCFPEWAEQAPSTASLWKSFEDRVDALFCAWLAARAWLYGGEVVGEASTGTIWLPYPPD